MTRNFSLIAGFAMLVSALPAAADIAMPTTVQVYFTRDGKPFEGSVDFSVTCRGWKSWPGRPRPADAEPKKIVEVYRYSAKCPAYGCEFVHSLYLNYTHIESCQASGTAGGKAFTLRSIGTSPVGDCNDPSRAGTSGRRCTLRLALPK